MADIKKKLVDMILSDENKGGDIMGIFTALAHNERLMLQAESIINNFLESETENHKVYCCLVNPDGTKIIIQKGFKLENGEYTFFHENGKQIMDE